MLTTAPTRTPWAPRRRPGRPRRPRCRRRRPRGPWSRPWGRPPAGSRRELRHLGPQPGREAATRLHPGLDDEGLERHHGPVGQHRAGETVVGDLHRGHLLLHDADAPRLEPGALLVGQRLALAEDGDVLAELAEQLGLVGGHERAGEHADHLVADLPAVAVRAVQDVGAPPLRAGPRRRGARRPGRWSRPAAGRATAEPSSRVAVKSPRRRGRRRRPPPARSRRTTPARRGRGAAAPRRDALVAEVVVDAAGRRVARVPLVDDEDPRRARARVTPALRPAAPPPTTRTSKSPLGVLMSWHEHASRSPVWQTSLPIWQTGRMDDTRRRAATRRPPPAGPAAGARHDAGRAGRDDRHLGEHAVPAGVRRSASRPWSCCCRWPGPTACRSTNFVERPATGDPRVHLKPVQATARRSCR